jgi:hypothetical protein
MSIRNNFLALLLAGAALSSGSAQALVNFMNVGIKGGMGLYSQSGGSLTAVSMKPGIIIGPSFQLIGIGPIGVDIDILYARRALEIAGVGQSANYLHMPAVAKLGLGFFNVQGGMYYAQGFGSVDRNGTSLSFSQASMVRGDFGLVFGGGIGLPLGLLSLTFDARFNWGLSNVSNISGANVTSKSIDLMAGVVF